jgi:hypothetical protein
MNRSDLQTVAKRVVWSKTPDDALQDVTLADLTDLLYQVECSGKG